MKEHMNTTQTKNSESVSNKQAFEWVKTGHWKFSDFSKWLDAQKAVKDSGEQVNISKLLKETK